jgi:hypothetical protein
VNDLARDLRYGWRGLRQRPGVTVAAVLALALGLGANSALYSIVRAVVLAPLPYAEPERLVALWETNAAKGLDQERLSPVNFLDYRSLTAVFSDAAACLVRPGSATRRCVRPRVPRSRRRCSRRLRLETPPPSSGARSALVSRSNSSRPSTSMRALAG